MYCFCIIPRAAGWNGNGRNSSFGSATYVIKGLYRISIKPASTYKAAGRGADGNTLRITRLGEGTGIGGPRRDPVQRQRVYGGSLIRRCVPPSPGRRRRIYQARLLQPAAVIDRGYKSPPCHGASKPSRLSEPEIKPGAEQNDHREHDEIAVFHPKFGHVGEIHPVDAGDRRRHRENGRPGGELAGDDALALLLEKVRRLEYRGEDFPQAPDPRLDAPHMVEHVVKVGAHVLIERGQRKMGELVAHLVHRPQHALEPDEFSAQRKEPADLAAVEKRVERPALGLQHVLLDRVDDRQVAVDDEVEDGVQHVIDAVFQERGRSFEVMAKVRMGARRSVPDADDKSFADEDRGLAVGDLVVDEMSGPRNDKKLVPVHVDLGELMGGERVLDRERMEAVVVLKPPELRFGRLEEANPDEFRALLGAGNRLIERHRPDRLAVAIEIGGDDGHRARLCMAFAPSVWGGKLPETAGRVHWAPSGLSQAAGSPASTARRARR